MIDIELGNVWSHYRTMNEEREVIDRRLPNHPSRIDTRLFDPELRVSRLNRLPAPEFQNNTAL